jgi:hypothetical protein
LSRETSEISRGPGRYLALEAGWPGAIGYAVLGAVVLWLISLAWPSGYRAEAGVLVQHNVERAVEDPSSDEAANYIDRETVVLESLAYSDLVWDAVGQALADEGWIETPDAIEGIRQGVRLPHPKNGEWRFTATTRDPRLSARVAGLWAETFVAEANRTVAAAVLQDAWATRLQEEAAALAARGRECDQLDAVAAELAIVDGNLRLADPTQAALQAEGLLLLRLVEEAGVAEAGGAMTEPTTVADQLTFAEALGKAVTVSRESCRTEADRLETEWESHQAEAAGLTAKEMTLSPLLEVSMLRQPAVPTAQITRPEVALGVGAIVGLCAWVVRVLLGTRKGSGGEEAG